MLRGHLEFGLSPALLFEYEDVLKRSGVLGDPPKVTMQEVDIVLDALARCARPARSNFRFRPVLDDPKDDLLIECALAANAPFILTRDSHFSPQLLKPFRLVAMTPKAFLQDIYRSKV